MSDPTPHLPANPAPATEAELPAPHASAEADGPAGWMRYAIFILCVVMAAIGWQAWHASKRLEGLEKELVRRQQDSQNQATEARVLAKQAEELSREAAARSTLLETRLAEIALQRTQVEDLIKSLSLSRDENLIFDIEASLRVATQQAALTGSAEPLIVAMQSADERLARTKHPRLDNVRRALAKDLDRARATRVTDINTLAIRLDEAARMVDDAPLLNQPDTGATSARPSASAKERNATTRKTDATDSEAQAQAEPNWRINLLNWGKDAAHAAWNETRSLVRLTRIAQPEAMLIAPNEAFFLRENIKLRLLNARLALMSRQPAQAAADLRQIERTLPRYFNAQSRKTQLLQSMVTAAIEQSQQTQIPRPDDTLAALAAVAASTGLR